MYFSIKEGNVSLHPEEIFSQNNYIIRSISSSKYPTITSRYVSEQNMGYGFCLQLMTENPVGVRNVSWLLRGVKDTVQYTSQKKTAHVSCVFYTLVNNYATRSLIVLSTIYWLMEVRSSSTKHKKRCRKVAAKLLFGRVRPAKRPKPRLCRPL